MENKELEKLRYPLGKFNFPETISESELEQFIVALQTLPQQVRTALKEVSELQLKAEYRTGGWNIKQLINHLVDSHTNSVIRFKLALTEHVPTIRPYDEQAWALLADTDNCPLELTLNLLENIHARWVILLKSMRQEDWDRKLFHPVSNREFTLKQFAALYAWHGQHHLAHIEIAKKKSTASI